jgi:putative transposase
MLSNETFFKWCEGGQLTPEAINLINSIRSGEPVRLTKSGFCNVSGRYPSVKMQRSIQFESHTVELPAIYTYEFDEDALEFYDQSSRLKLTYPARNGRRIGVLHVPDFFVIRNGGIAGWEEWKPEDRLLHLAQTQPGRYVWDENKKVWRCPPGEQFAEKYGLYYRLRSSKELDWNLLRNLMYLEDYFCA